VCFQYGCTPIWGECRKAGLTSTFPEKIKFVLVCWKDITARTVLFYLIIISTLLLNFCKKKQETEECLLKLSC
jgi:hypothetical protein